MSSPIDSVHEMYTGVQKAGGFTKHYYTLYAIVEGMEAKKTFEFGTGLTTMIICSALKEGAHHTSCDISPRSKFQHPPADYDPGNWTFLHGDSRKVADQAKGPFDFVLHDGSHEAAIVEQDLRMIIPKMKNNSILMIHDTDSINYGRSLHNAAVDALGDLKHELVTLPYGYGLTIVRILGNQHNGTIKPVWTKTHGY